MEIEVAKMLNYQYDSETGRVFILMEVIDPVMKQRVIRESLKVKLIIEDEDANL